MKKAKIRKISSGTPVIYGKYCDTFLSKLIGLMFSKELKVDQGVILVEKKESRINTSIHMMFMNYDLAVLWLDKNLIIVDKILAKRWMPAYFPKKPAQYVIELHPSIFTDFSIGEQLSIESGE